MRLTLEEINKTTDLGQLKGWLNAMQKHAKSATPPEFTISGPCQLVVRIRASNAGKKLFGGGTMAANHSLTKSFMGGEKFKLSDVFKHHQSGGGSILLQASFIPSDLASAGEIVGLTMPIDQAADTFDGLEAWMGGVAPLEKPKVVSKAEREKQERELEETITLENQDAGSW